MLTNLSVPYDMITISHLLREGLCPALIHIFPAGDYTICVRREKGNCAIGWTPPKYSEEPYA